MKLFIVLQLSFVLKNYKYFINVLQIDGVKHIEDVFEDVKDVLDMKLSKV